MTWTLVLFGLILSSIVLAVLVALVRRQAVPRLLVLWYAAPFVGLAGLMLVSVAAGPPTSRPLDNAIFGFMLFASIGIVPWTIAFATGLALGSVLRLLLWGSGGREPADEAPTQQPPIELGCWHVGFARDGLRVNGLDVWTLPWHEIGVADLELPHPAHPHQRHWFTIYEIRQGRRTATFAAGELSNSVWGFYPWRGERPAIAPGARSKAGRPAYGAMVLITLAAFFFIGAATYLVETARLSPPPRLTPIPEIPKEIRTPRYSPADRPDSDSWKR